MDLNKTFPLKKALLVLGGVALLGLVALIPTAQKLYGGVVASGGTAVAGPYVITPDPNYTSSSATTTKFFGSVLPQANHSFDIGATSSVWRAGYFDNITVSGCTGCSSGVPASTATLQQIASNGASTTNLLYLFNGFLAASSTVTSTFTAVGDATFNNVIINGTCTGSGCAGGGVSGLGVFGTLTTGNVLIAQNTSTAGFVSGFNLTTSTLGFYLPADYTMYATNTVAVNSTSTALFATSFKATSSTIATLNAGLFNTAQGTSTIWGFVNGSGTFVSIGSLYVTTTIDTAGGLNMTCAGVNCKKTLTLSAAGCNQPSQAPSVTSSLVYFGNNVYRTSNFQPLALNRCQLDWIPPDSWDGGTLTAQFLYAVTTTDNNGITWGIQGQGVGDGAALATEFSAATATVTLVATTTNALTVSTGTTLTIGGVTSDPYLVKLQLSRVAAPGVSTNTAALVGVKLEYGVNKLTD